MTAVITLATIAGPIGLVAAGPLIEHAGLSWTFATVAGGETAVSLLFIVLIARFRRAQSGSQPLPSVTGSAPYG